jgi:hypothetical protein
MSAKTYTSRGLIRVCSVPTLYDMYINDTSQTNGVHIVHKEGYGLRKFQCELNSMMAWCERWNIKINENKTLAKQPAK